MVAGKLSRMPVRSMPWIGLDWIGVTIDLT
jgi:hypothetical protein